MDKSLGNKIKEYREEEKNIKRELDDIEQELHQQSLKGKERSFESLYSKIAKDRYEQRLKEAANSVVNLAKSQGPMILSKVPLDILYMASDENLTPPKEPSKGSRNDTDKNQIPKKPRKREEEIPPAPWCDYH